MRTKPSDALDVFSPVNYSPTPKIKKNISAINNRTYTLVMHGGKQKNKQQKKKKDTLFWGVYN